MRTANIVSGMVLAVFGLSMIFVILPIQIEEGPPGMVSPRLVPQIMLWVITCLSLLLAASNLRSGRNDEPSPISKDEVIALVKVAAAFAAALTLYFTAGALWAGVVLVAGTLLLLGERRIHVIVLMTGGILGMTWLLFYQILGTPIL